MNEFARRDMIVALAAVGGLTLTGCDPSEKSRDKQAQAPGWTSGASSPQAASMTVYRDPSCGCCKAWADIARKAGYQVTLVDRSDMPAIKQQAGVPDALMSCHTAIVGGYAIEGHVPMEDVARLLKERPSGIKGIAVAGMPRGSPGMEMPDGTKDPFQVIGFDASGRTSIYRG